MPVELGGAQTLGLDTGPAIAALDAYGKKADLTAATIVKGQEAVNTSFAEAARQATAYSDSLARQQAEVRNAASATQSAREELRRLTDQQRQYAAEQRKVKDGSDEYRRLQKLLEQNRTEIAKAKQAINENRAATDQERAAVEKLRDARRQATNSAKEEAAAAKDAAEAAKKGVESGGGLNSLFGRAAGVFAGLFAVEKVKEVGQEIINVTGEFQKYETVLTNAFQGDNARAKAALLQIQAFADANGLSIDALTDTYVKLVNRGIIPTQQQLRQLSDIAATSGKSTDQFVEALLDAQTGEFERLKEFGIKVKNNGDTLSFVFRGVATEVKNSQQAISDYLFALGDLNGVQGTTAALAEQTNGRLATLKNSFTELFLTIGQGTGGPINAFVKGLTIINQKANEFLKTDKQKIAEQAAINSQQYAESIDKQFQFAAERAKKNGKSVYYAVYDVAQLQQKELQKQLEEATKNINELTSIDKSFRNTADRAALVTRITGRVIKDPNDESDLRDAEREALNGQKTYLEYVRQSQDALKRRTVAAVEGATKEEVALGRIEALRKKIAADEKERDRQLDTVAGNARRVQLNAQLKQERDLLDELLGKEKALKKAREYNYDSQLRALLNERRMLTELAAKASEKVATTEGERAALVFKQSLAQVDKLKAALESRERDLQRAAFKAGGAATVNRLGELADGRIGAPEQEKLNQLKLAAVEQYYRELYAIEAAREQRLFELRESSNAKEFDAVERHYAALRRAATDNVERQAVERARVLAQIALLQQQQQRQIEQTANIGASNATVIGATYGEGTGTGQIAAKRAERDELLRIQKEYAEKTLRNAGLLAGEERKVAEAAAGARLAQIKESIRAVEAEKASHKADDFLYQLILGKEGDSDENRQKLNDIVNEFKSALLQTTQATIQAADAKISAHDREIEQLSASLSAQIQLNKDGSASNIKNILSQIEEEKSARAAAREEKRAALRQEMAINQLQQASALATAAANLILGWSTLPVVGQVLGALSVAAMLASFLAAKSTAESAAQSGFFKGGYTGGDSTTEERGPVHGKEFVFDNEKTSKYRFSLFEPLHTGKQVDWSAPELQALLPNTELPERLAADKAQFMRVQHEHSFAPLQAELAGVKAELAEIKASNKAMADKPDAVPLGGGRYELLWPNGSTKIVNT